MTQHWINVAGLSADFIGFCLLLREWWLAFFFESSALAQEQRRTWEKSVRHFHHTHAPEAHRPHLDASARMRDDMAERQARDQHLSTLGARKRVFITAAILIIAGFLLQILAAAPGCCPPLIVPGL